MSLITREILTGACLPTERRHVPELGGEVIIRALSLRQRHELEQRATRDDGVLDSGMLLPLMAGACLVDEQGARLLTDEEALALGDTLPYKAFIALSEAVQAINDAGRAYSAEAEKNSVATQGGDFFSA